MSSYYHYFTFGFESYIDDLLVRIREEVFRVFRNVLQPQPSDSILDVGASADDHISSNHFVKRYPHSVRICALGIDHLPSLLQQFPGITVVQGDARALPFGDSSFDFVHSHAVIEHVGSRRQQALFLNEALRVSRKGVLITTPNRWHPFETHTGIPLLHFLPSVVYRGVYKTLGKGMYATEESLNLLSAGDLRQLANELPHSASLHAVRWLGITSNLVLVIRKQ